MTTRRLEIKPLIYALSLLLNPIFTGLVVVILLESETDPLDKSAVLSTPSTKGMMVPEDLTKAMWCQCPSLTSISNCTSVKLLPVPRAK